MILALALAAQVASAPPPTVERTPNLYSEPAHCRSVVEREVQRQQVALQGRRPAAQYALLRQLDGCSVPTPMGYHPDYVVPGAADPAVKREDAPPNRR